MRLNDKSEMELKSIANDIEKITQRLNVFRRDLDNTDGIKITPEYMELRYTMSSLQREFDSL
jgi:hypothetical protein